MDFSIKPYIKDTKAQLRKSCDVKASFADIKEGLASKIDAIINLRETGRSVVPELTYADIQNNKVSGAASDAIRAAGCAIVRGVFPRALAESWNTEVGDYIERNDYIAKSKAKAGLDTYFADLDAGAPQIFGLYWSRPQVMARQAASMAETKRFMNRLWSVDGPAGPEFDPDFDYAYADRTRRREPGDTTLGLSPHMDAGSYERWLDPAFQAIYGEIFAGNWRDYDPWRARYRTQTREFDAPAVASMFRTFQGWTALSEQGPQDGTLKLLPIANSIAYFLMRALQDDVAEDDLCGAEPGRALGASADWHSDILHALTTIQTVEPGDTVWWHPDIIHAVADENAGGRYANVMYIGASPKCRKNEVYARRQGQTFLKGESPPDFAPENYEVDFDGRATLEDLTELGKAQMGLT